MTIQLVFPTLPPAIDGIGAYTASLGEALALHANVTILTAASHADVGETVSVVPNAFSLDRRDGIGDLFTHVSRTSPDWVVLQYNPFSYGRWGLNLALPRALHRLRNELPDTRLAVMVHEPFVPLESWRFAVMTTWQRWQLWQLGQAADLLFFSIAPWVDRFQSWFPETEVQHLPVGSNIPTAEADRDSVRRHLSLNGESVVVGLFGSGHFSRLLPFVHRAVERLSTEHPSVDVLYIGPAGRKVRAALSDIPLRDAGILSPPDVSRHFAAMDLYLAPFRKGVSSRRGSLLVGLQHGIPTVSTYGSHTDDFFYREAERSLLLSPDNRPDVYARQVSRLAADRELRERIGQAGQEFFRSTFAWSHIAKKMIDAFADASDRRRRRQPVVTASP